MVKVQVTDYQSIKKAVLDIDRLTILKGESNAGKSSIFKAIYDATHNRFRMGAVRFGEDYATVTIKYSDDPRFLKVLRESTGGSPKMRLGNKSLGYRHYDKLNRDVPVEVQEFNNFGKVDVSANESVSLNFFSQFTPPLLLGFSPKRVVDLLSYSVASQDALEATKALRERNTYLRGQFSAFNSILADSKSELGEAREELKKYNNIDTVKTHYRDLQEATKIKTLSEESLKVLNNLNTIDEQTSKCSSIVEPTLKAQLLQKDIEVIKSSIATIREYFSNLHKISKVQTFVNELPKVRELNELVKTINVSIIDKRTLKSLYNEKVIVKRILNQLTESMRLHVQVDTLNRAVTVSTAISKINNKGRIASQIYRSSSEINQHFLQSKVVKTFAEYNSVLEDIKELETNQANRVCPYCSSTY